MVTILEDAPRKKSFLEKLSQGVSGGLTSGLDTAMQLRGEKKKEDQERQMAISKERAGLGKEINAFIKDYGQADFNMPSLRRKLDETADSFVQQGYSKRDAVRMAHDYISKEMQESGQLLPSQQKEEPSTFQKEMADMSRTISKKDLAKVGRPFAQLADIPGHLYELAQQGAGLQGGIGPQLQRNKEVPKATEWYDKLTGGMGVPETRGDQFRAAVLSGGIPGLGAEAVMQGAEAVGAPEWLQNTLGILSFVGTHRLSSVRPKGFGTSNKIVSKAEKIAKETGQPVEEILATAERSSGANLAKVMQGDVKEASKVDEALSQSMKRISETPKQIFNPKAAEKERALFGKRVAESPLEEYYDIEARAAEKAAKKTAPTLAKEEAITQRLAPVEKQLSAKANEIKDQLTRMQQAKRGVPESGRARIDVLIAEKEKQLSKIMGELDETRYELRNFRAKPTEAQTAKQIEDSIDRFRKEAKAPTPEGQAKITKDLEGDRKYLEVASKLDKRGQLPGDLKPDTYIQMQQKYLDAYKEAIKSEREAVKGMKKGERASGDQFIQYLSDRVKALEAKIVQQTDKQKAIRGLEKPSGAFYKQQLKETRKDLERFQKDFFKHTGRIKSIESAKAHTVAKEALRKSPEVAKKEVVREKGLVEKELGRFEEKSAEKASNTFKNPTKENIEKLAKETDSNPWAIRKDVEDIKKALPVGDGIITPSIEQKIAKGAIKLAKTVGWSSGWGVLQAVIEEHYGWKPSAAVGTLVAAAIVGKSGSKGLGKVFISGAVYQFVKGLFEKAEIQKIHKLKPGSDERFLYEKKMREKRGKTQSNRIMKAVHEEDMK